MHSIPLKKIKYLFMRGNTSQIEWRDIIGLRHVLVHGYYQISNDIVWKTINVDLKPLQKNILDILNNIE
ncbi:MAG: DUF86 domain-containing protein [Bacteroidales bacterium]|nr:DUF86 domain-containing protein [Bacteroidales bacterium]